MVYSTCSLNPIEDEAVIAALLEKSEGKNDETHMTEPFKKKNVADLFSKHSIVFLFEAPQLIRSLYFLVCFVSHMSLSFWLPTVSF